MNRLVIFDLDGTLIDTPSGIVEAFTDVFRTMGVEEKKFAEIRDTIGLPLEEAFSNLLGMPCNNECIAEAITLYHKAFGNLILPKAEMLIFPGVLDGLSRLHDLGCILAIATSKYYKSADTLLEAAKIRGQFDVLVGADQVKKPKPDTEMGLKIMRGLGVSEDCAIMVGDTTHDIKMARSLGINSVAVTYGVHSNTILSTAQPTWMADTFDDVVTQIKTYFISYE